MMYKQYNIVDRTVSHHYPIVFSALLAKTNMASMDTSSVMDDNNSPSSPSSPASDSESALLLLKSPVWDHFALIDGNHKCKHCSYRKPHKKGSGTTNMVRHIKDTHPGKWKLLEPLMAARQKKRKQQQNNDTSATQKAKQTRISFNAPSTSTIPPPSAAEQVRLQLELFRITAEADISFRALTESAAYREQMKRLINWDVPSRMMLSRALPEYYETCMKSLVRELSQIESISITTDSTYLTRQETPYIAITGHWLDNQWCLHDTMLAMFPAQQSETAEYISTQLRRILHSDLNLSHKIHCVVTDEGANFLNAAEIMRDREDIRESIRCGCHRIQLAFRNAIQEAINSKLLILLKKVQTVVLMFRNGWASKKKDVLRKWQLKHLENLRTQLQQVKDPNNRNMRNKDKEVSELSELVTSAEKAWKDEQDARSARERSTMSLTSQITQQNPSANEIDVQTEVNSSDDEEESSESDSEVENDIDEPAVDSHSDQPPRTFDDIIEVKWDEDYSKFIGDPKRLYSHMCNKKALIQKCATRWMTYVDVVDRFLIWGWSIEKSLEEMKGRQARIKRKKVVIDPNASKFSQSDVAILKEFLLVGKATKVILKRCESSNNSFTTISSLLHNSTVLYKNLLKWSIDPALSETMKNFCVSASTRVHLKFDPVVDSVALTAALLDPRYRELQMLDPVSRQRSKNSLSNLWSIMDAERKEAQHEEEDANEPFPIEFDLDARADLAPKKSKKISEYDLYVRGENEAKDTDPLLWWKQNEHQFPLLSILARRYLAIPASSAASERVFSRLKNTLTAKRVHMHPKTVCQLQFVRCHYKYLTVSEL